MRLWWAASCLFLALVTTLGAQTGEGERKFKGDFDAFFKKLDGNKDGKLNKDEFLKMAERAKEKEQARKKLNQAYDKLDPEQKGVTKDQFKRFLENGKRGEELPNPVK